MPSPSFATPILDLEISPKGNRLRQVGRTIAGFIAGGAVTAAVLFFSGRYIELRLPGSRILGAFAGWIAPAYQLPPLLFFSTLAAALLLMTTIHESGHAIAVKLVNWQLTSFNSAGFSARFTHWRWKYSYSFHGLWHGSVGFIPYTPLRFRHKLRIIALGGPFANLVTTFFAFTLSAHLANGYFKSFLAALASWSLLIGVLNLLPCKFGRAEWDGYIAFRGLRTQEWHRAKLASMMLARATLDGVDHLLWNQRWFSLTKPTGKPYLQQVQPLFLHYANFHSSNQPEHAAEMLEHALSVSSRGSEPLRRLLYVQAAYFHAVWRRDYDKAVAWMGRIEKPALVEPYMQLSLDAALAWSRNDFAKFEALTAQGRAAVLALPPSKMRDQQIIEWDRETERLRRIAEPHKPIGTEAAQA